MDKRYVSPFRLRATSGELAALHVVAFVFVLALSEGVSAQAPDSQSALALEKIQSVPPAEVQLANTPAATVLGSRPPLSISDVIAAMNETADILRDSSGRINADSNHALRERLDAMSAYIRAVDDTNPTLPYYQWHFVDRSKVTETMTDTDVFRTPRALPGVTAISLKVIRGDVRVERVRVFDKSGTAFEFNLGKVIPADSPRREICMLETELALDRVEISYRGVSRQEAKAPRLILEAGISSVPEYARQCNYELKLASKSIEGKDFATGEKRMREAARLLSAYLQSRRM